MARGSGRIGCPMKARCRTNVSPTRRKPGSATACWWRPWLTLTNAKSIFWRSEEHTSELQSLMRISYAVFCLKKKKKKKQIREYKTYKHNTTKRQEIHSKNSY